MSLTACKVSVWIGGYLVFFTLISVQCIFIFHFVGDRDWARAGLELNYNLLQTQHKKTHTKLSNSRDRG